MTHKTRRLRQLHWTRAGLETLLALDAILALAATLGYLNVFSLGALNHLSEADYYRLLLLVAMGLVVGLIGLAMVLSCETALQKPVWRPARERGPRVLPRRVGARI